MAYIQLHQSIFNHRKTLAAAKILKINRFEFVGHIAALWAWAIDNAEDGELPRDADIVSHAAGWTKDPVLFAGVLKQVGFIDCGPRGEWWLHDWGAYAGRLIEARKKSRDRQRKWRENQE